MTWGSRYARTTSSSRTCIARTRSFPALRCRARWNRETSDYYDTNGFLIRPAVVGDVRPKKYDVGYLGLNGDGHFGRWNLTATAYWALGHDDHNPYSQQGANINAFYGVAEVSRDFDWLRVRGTALFQSGDKNPFDNKENGFDAILEDPKIAGADTSFWIRQAIPLIGGGGVTLSQRNGVLADLRSSKDQGQSNFINPGLTLIGLGADADITPRWRGIINLNELWFNETGSLAVLRQQGSISKNIGTDLSLAVQYRPLFNENIVLNVSAAWLFPGQGFKDLYPSWRSAAAPRSHPRAKRLSRALTRSRRRRPSARPSRRPRRNRSDAKPATRRRITARCTSTPASSSAAPIATAAT